MTLTAAGTRLPSLDSDYPLSVEQITKFQTNGHILLRAVASPEEIGPYRQAITAHTTEFAKRYKALEERDTYGRAFIQFENLWQRHPEVAAFTLARRFARIAAELMGVEGVRIYHDQSLYKEPGGGHTPWHQDQSYWPLDGAKAGTLWMPLVDVSAEMGTMRFASGSHTLGYLGNIVISDESESYLERLVRENGYPVALAGAMAAGDCTFHNGWTIHGAPGNASADRTREVMTIIYVEDGAVITEPDSAVRGADLRSWFPGLKPGNRAASPLNPLVYHRTRKP
jgi:ectoine hydroxylase-related dioxygenase (phytanoyl-CoA dioxygenase family)